MAQAQINDEVMQLKPSELALYLRFCLDSGPTGIVPFVTGGIGLGKSSIAKQTAAYYRREDPGFGYIEYRTATQEPTDVSGVPMPNLVDNCTDFLKPGRLKRLPKNWRGIVFLDEFTKAAPSVTNAWSQPILDRWIDDLELPAGLRFIVAGNRRVDKSSDTDLGMFMYNRMSQVELVPDVEDTVAYFKSIGVREDLTAFLKFGGQDHLYNYNPDKKVHATPRTWEMVGLACDEADKKGYPEVLQQAAVCGLIGKGPSYAYMSFRKMLKDIPPVSEVIANPMGTKVFTDASTAYALALCLARKADPSNIAAIMQYMDRNEIETAAAFVSDAIKRCPSLKETKSYIDWCVKHRDLEIS